MLESATVQACTIMSPLAFHGQIVRNGGITLDLMIGLIIVYGNRP